MNRRMNILHRATTKKREEMGSEERRENSDNESGKFGGIKLANFEGR